MDFKRIGYDRLAIYTKEELEELYIKQGLTPEEASKLAEVLYKELESSTEAERKLWRKVRKREQTGVSQEDIEDAARI